MKCLASGHSTYNSALWQLHHTMHVFFQLFLISSISKQQQTHHKTYLIVKQSYITVFSLFFVKTLFVSLGNNFISSKHLVLFNCSSFYNALKWLFFATDVVIKHGTYVFFVVVVLWNGTCLLLCMGIIIRCNTSIINHFTNSVQQSFSRLYFYFNYMLVCWSSLFRLPFTFVPKQTDRVKLKIMKNVSQLLINYVWLIWTLFSSIHIQEANELWVI